MVSTLEAANRTVVSVSVAGVPTSDDGAIVNVTRELPYGFGEQVALPAATAVAQPPTKRFIWMLRVFCVVALGVSGYLAFAAIRSTDVAGCGGGEVFDCGHVLHSRWSKVFGVPVSVPAFALYVAMLVALSVCRPGASGKLQRFAWAIVTVGATSAGLSAVWFVGLQIFELGHLCQYCLVAHACGLAACGAIWWNRPLGTRTTGLLATASIAGVGLLIGGQALAEPPETFKIERHEAAQPQPEETIPVEFAAPIPFDGEGPDGRSESLSAEDQNIEVFEPF